jgi:hypothetical protein
MENQAYHHLLVVPEGKELIESTTKGERMSQGTANTVHLVMGISSCGKSSYIGTKTDSGEWKDLPIFMAHEINHQLFATAMNQECIVHYNLLRVFGNKVKHFRNDIMSEPLLIELLKQKER